MTYAGEGGIADIKQRIYREKGTVNLDPTGFAQVDLVYPVPIGVHHVLLTPFVAANGQPVVANIVEFLDDGTNTTGFRIRGQQLRGMPSPLTLVTDIAGFNVWEAAPTLRVEWMFF